MGTRFRMAAMLPHGLPTGKRMGVSYLDRIRSVCHPPPFMSGEDARYRTNQGTAEAAFEERCKRCGRCCGSDNDPCMHLKRQPDGTWLCEIYESRLGWRKTVGGNRFRCVPIRDNIRLDALPPGCGYRRR